MYGKVDKQIRRRNKPSFSCTNCKARKVKCNRDQPCSSCVRSRLNESCVFSVKKSANMVSRSNSTVENGNKSLAINELQALKDKINQLEKSLSESSSNQDIGERSPLVLEDSSDGTQKEIKILEIPPVDSDNSFNIYEGYCSLYIKEPYRRVNFGPLTWLCFMNKDPWLRVLCKYTNEHDDSCICIYTKKIPRINKKDSSVFSSSENDELKGGKISEKVFRRRLLEQLGYDELAPFKSPNNIKPEEFIKQSKSLNSSSIAFARALIDGKFDAELHLFEKIKRVTPKKKALWSLVDIFFERLYPFMPYLDQKSFITTLTKIFGPVSYVDEPVEEISLKRKLDLAIVAQFLIIIRLTYLSLFSNRECVNEYVMNTPTTQGASYDYRYLLSTPVNLTTIDVAQKCIDTFQFSRKSNLMVLQALLFMRIYRKLAPEYGDGLDGGDSLVGSAIIGQVAISLGLNREPNNFPDTCNDERTNSLGRKIWAAIVQDSYLNSLMSGSHNILNTRNADVLEPYFDGKNSNIYDSDLERMILENFTWLPNKIPVDDFLDNVTTIKKSIITNEFTNDLNNIEKICLEELLTIGKSSNRKEIAFLEVKRAQLFLLIRGSLSSAYSHLFFHFEATNNRDMAFFFVKKQYFILYEEFIPYYFEVLLGKYNSFGLALNPAIILCLHKSNQHNLYLLARLRFLKICMEKNPSHLKNLNQNAEYNRDYQSISNLILNVKRVLEQIITCLTNFASRYYHAWRVSRAHSLLSKFLLEDDIYKTMLRDNTYTMKNNFNAEEIRDLEEITCHIINRFARIINYKDFHDLAVPQFFEDPQHIGSPQTNINNMSTTPSDQAFPINEEIDKLWLLMFLDQNYPNVLGLDFEFDLPKDNVEQDGLTDPQLNGYLSEFKL